MSRDIQYEIKNLLPESVFISIKKDLQITEDIDTEVDQAAAQFGFYAVLSEKAETRYQKMKFGFEQWRAQVESNQIMLRAREAKKPFTEAQMKSHVMSQMKYKAFQIRLIQYDEQRRIIKVIAKAFELKKDLVQTKSSNRRKESR
jgi:hypothetical protein